MPAGRRNRSAGLWCGRVPWACAKACRWRASRNYWNNWKVRSINDPGGCQPAALRLRFFRLTTPGCAALAGRCVLRSRAGLAPVELDSGLPADRDKSGGMEESSLRSGSCSHCRRLAIASHCHRPHTGRAPLDHPSRPPAAGTVPWSAGDGCAFGRARHRTRRYDVHTRPRFRPVSRTSPVRPSRIGGWRTPPRVIATDIRKHGRNHGQRTNPGSRGASAAGSSARCRGTGNRQRIPAAPVPARSPRSPGTRRLRPSANAGHGTPQSRHGSQTRSAGRYLSALRTPFSWPDHARSTRGVDCDRPQSPQTFG